MSIPTELLPELKEWNNGRGISPLEYFFCLARSSLTVASIDLFWPKFVLFQEYVLREGFLEEDVRLWEKQQNITRKNIEAAINYLDIGGLFMSTSDERSDTVDARRNLVRHTLAEIYQVKLLKDFPNRRFKVDLEGDDEDMALTFYQI